MTEGQKVVDVETLAPIRETLRRAGRKVVFTNGCFDILHAGHVRYLAAARAEGDALVVGLNSDASVRRIKGSRRPIHGEGERAEVLAALAAVDYVVLFEEADPLALIRRLVPDVLVKGADWSEERIVGADVVRAAGGRVVRVDLVPEASTTGTIRRILDRYAGGKQPERRGLS
jgi:D-beta-D-heptose 7-phosphate kinase/D-beta-D-heptose 1-phosphate adenosyltransferase